MLLDPDEKICALHSLDQSELRSLLAHLCSTAGTDAQLLVDISQLLLDRESNNRSTLTVNGSDLSVAELKLSPFPFLENNTPIRKALQHMLHEQCDSILITNEGEITGHVTVRSCYDAIRMGIESCPVGVLSVGLPLQIPIDSSAQQLQQYFSTSVNTIAVVIDRPETASTLGIVLRSQLSQASPVHINAAKTLGSDLCTLLSQIDECAQLSGCTLRLVGGVVRDIILGKDVQDIDCVAIGDLNALSKSLTSRFPNSKINRELAFGAIHWSIGTGAQHWSFDITHSRTESYRLPGALPEVKQSHFLADARRRDFTINALSIPLSTLSNAPVMDYFGGLSDLEDRQIRTIHGLSFIDDFTRAFRAAKYSGRLDFLLAPATEQSLCDALRLGALNTLSLERIGMELARLFEEEQRAKCFEHLLNWGVLGKLFPQHPNLAQTLVDHCNQITVVLDKFRTLGVSKKPQIGRVCWIILGHLLGNQGRRDHGKLIAPIAKGKRLWTTKQTLIERLFLTSKESTQVSAWGLVYELSNEVDWLALWILYPDSQISLSWWITTGQHLRSELNGHDLIDAGCPKGPLIGRALSKARAVAYQGKNHVEQLAAAREIWLATDQPPE